MTKKNPIQARIEQERACSPLKELSNHQQALLVSNSSRKGVPTGNVTKGCFEKGHATWNKGQEGKLTWGKTRSERAKTMSQEEHKAYFGTVEKHSEETKKQMSASASARWRNQMRTVIADGETYANIIAASEALGLHKDTVVYRIKNTRAKWAGWSYGV